MRSLPACLVSAVAVVLLASCSSGGGETGSSGEEEPSVPEEGTSTAAEAATDEHTYPPHAEMSVELATVGSDDGGRLTSFFSGYRVAVEFDHAEQSSECTVQLPEELAEFRPGETHLIVLECVDEIVVPASETGFTALENEREIGRGDVVLTDA